ncbi:MAG: hypothetical protein KFF73_14685, partial [Cyclobacteriaceae bacterium]|nr:hypothetical protein [Cyclobacteriaceae bacterium]
HQDLKASVFLTAGELEGESMISQVKKMGERLSSRGYPGLKLDIQVFQNEDHRSCIGAAYMRAFHLLCTGR